MQKRQSSRAPQPGRRRRCRPIDRSAQLQPREASVGMGATVCFPRRVLPSAYPGLDRSAGLLPRMSESEIWISHLICTLRLICFLTYRLRRAIQQHIGLNTSIHSSKIWPQGSSRNDRANQISQQAFLACCRGGHGYPANRRGLILWRSRRRMRLSGLFTRGLQPGHWQGPFAKASTGVILKPNPLLRAAGGNSVDVVPPQPEGENEQQGER
jgi:hypothetical protein